MQIKLSTVYKSKEIVLNKANLTKSKKTSKTRQKFDFGINRAEAPISIIACPHRDRVIINRESYSVTFLTDQSACSLQHRESWLSAVWWSLSVVAECLVHIVVFIL